MLGGTGAVSGAVAAQLDSYTTGVVERWAGADRFASSAAFSAKSYPVGVSVAYVANGMNFPDALSGAPIAGKTGGPVLLTQAGSLPSAIAQELSRLKPQRIVVLGGTGAVSTTVQNQLASYPGADGYRGGPARTGAAAGTRGPRPGRCPTDDPAPRAAVWSAERARVATRAAPQPTGST